MVPQPTPYRWLSSKYYGVGAVIKPTTANGAYFQCAVAGQSAAAEPTWNATVGTTTVDNGITWTAIAKPTYSYYAELEFATSGLTAAKGAGLLASLNYVDITGAVSVLGYLSYYDISGSSGAPPQFAAATGRLRSAPLNIPADTMMRYLYIQVGEYLDSGGSINLGISRASIRSVIAV
jgi:hypothetical protein